MKANKAIVYLAAAALIAAAFAAAMGMMRAGETPPKAAVEPNLFSFIKPADRVMTEVPGKASDAPRRSEPPDPAQLAFDIASAQATAQKMRAQGAGGEEIERMRAAALPAQTAAHLALMDNAEAGWKARVDAYFAERNRLLDNLARAPASDRDQVLRQLRESRFTPEEQALLATYEAAVPRLIQE